MGAWHTRGAGLVLASAAVLLISGCGTSSKACSAVGAVSGISVDASAVQRAHPGAHLTTTVCIARARCRTVDEPGPGVVASGAVHGVRPVEVRVVIATATGRMVFSGHTRALPVRLQPNGRGCPPVAWAARVIATDRHSLSSAPLLR